ncbi:azurin [Luteimonas sp. MJ204]|uniref:azurin n=1 Tax=Luteimonas TaxID=83614 RepID=UPI0031BB00D3
MNIKIAVLTAACALALSACGETASPPAATDAAPDAASPAAPAADTPAEATPPAADTTPAATSKAPAKGSKVAVINGCETEIEGNDAMQFNVNSITVPASCAEFTITLKHVGKMPVAAMGHNVVVTTAADMAQVSADGMAAGLEAGFIKSDDDKVIAHTDMIGGGETTSVTFAVSELQGDGPYKFFCSFPGHAALMNGSISVE